MKLRTVIILLGLGAFWLAGGALAAAGDAETEFARAERYFETKDFAAAARTYQAVLDADPQGPYAGAAAFRIGMCWFALGEYDAAVQAFAKFEEGFPKSPYLDDAVFLSAQAHFRTGDYHRCFERLLRTLAFGKKCRYYDRAVRGLGNLADETLSAEQLRKRLEDYPHSEEAAKVLLKLGKHEMGRGAFDKAVVILDAVVKGYPGTPEAKEAQEQLAAAREKVGRAATAVGVILPLSGDCAVYGKVMKAAIEIAAEDSNALHPEEPVTLVFEDTAAAGAEEAARKVIFEARAIAILGPALTDDVKAVAPLCEQYQIPLLSPAATDGTLARLNEYIYLNGLTFESETAAMAAYAGKNIGAKRFAILYPDNAYGRDIKGPFAAAVKAQGGTVVGEVAYPLIDIAKAADKREINYSPYTKKVKWLRADAVFLPGHYNEIVRLLPQLTFSDVSSYILGANGWNENRVVRVGAKYVEGTYFTAGFFADDPDPRVRNFVAAYRRKTADFPNYLAAQAYDAGAIVFKNLYPAAKSGADIKGRLDAVKDFRGITGITTLRGKDGLLQKDVLILTVREGEVGPAPRR